MCGGGRWLLSCRRCQQGASYACQKADLGTSLTSSEETFKPTAKSSLSSLKKALEFLNWLWPLDALALCGPQGSCGWLQRHPRLASASRAPRHWGNGQQSVGMHQKGEGHKEENCAVEKRGKNGGRGEGSERRGSDHSAGQWFKSCN